MNNKKWVPKPGQAQTNAVSPPIGNDRFVHETAWKDRHQNADSCFTVELKYFFSPSFCSSVFSKFSQRTCAVLTGKDAKKNDQCGFLTDRGSEAVLQAQTEASVTKITTSQRPRSVGQRWRAQARTSHGPTSLFSTT